MIFKINLVNTEKLLKKKFENNDFDSYALLIHYGDDEELLTSDIVNEYTYFDIDVWKKFIDVNIMGTVYFSKAVIDKMIENNYGRIINVASLAGVYGNANMAHYSATKVR